MLSSALLRPEDVHGQRLHGHAASVLGVTIGFGANMLSAVRFGKRLLLLNGSHRAHALRANGCSHVPCIVHTPKREEDLDLIAPAEVCRNADLYFRSARPPLFKDYFDEQLHTRFSAPRRNLVLQVEVTIRQSCPPAG